MRTNCRPRITIRNDLINLFSAIRYGGTMSWAVVLVFSICYTRYFPRPRVCLIRIIYIGRLARICMVGSLNARTDHRTAYIFDCRPGNGLRVISQYILVPRLGCGILHRSLFCIKAGQCKMRIHGATTIPDDCHRYGRDFRLQVMQYPVALLGKHVILRHPDAAVATSTMDKR